MECIRCKGHAVKDGKKYGLTLKQRYFCHNCRHHFYIKIGQPTPKLKRFSVRRETLRQIIHADIEEDKDRKVKEYSF